MPAPVAIRAASTLVCMPPVPTPAAPALPIRTGGEVVLAVHVGEQPATPGSVGLPV